MKKLPSKRKLVPGDAGYKSATQLRNDRKRRALRKGRPSQGTQHVLSDPSLLYISNPRKAPVVQRAIQFFRQETGHDFHVVVGPMKGWRTVSKLPVRSMGDKNNTLAVGLFQPKTHKLIHGSGSSAVQHTSINQAVTRIQSCARACNILAYDESSGEGDFRNISVNVERATGKVQITIIWNGEVSDKVQRHNAQKFANRLVKDMHEQLHSLWIHFNSSWKHDNAIVSRTGAWELVYGPGQVVEYLNLLSLQERPADSTIRVPLHFPPNVFRQANLDAFTQIVIKIREYVFQEQVDAICELYGGVGTIGLHLVDLCKTLVSSDENPHNKACFDKSVAAIANHRQCNGDSISYVSKNAEKMVADGCLDDADCVVVDPPRKGLDMSVATGLVDAKRPRLLVYVSCGFDAFLRDYAVLQKGRWKLVHAEGHILFPGSDAIEALAFFKRK
jgi:tRNA/tmRNA/rRNA uracil-C5-methylase (TrmA/RlmC/RlmD family)